MSMRDGMRVFCGVALALAIGGRASSQVDGGLLSQLNATDHTPQGEWEKKYDEAKTKQERLELLRIAWNKSKDPSISDDEHFRWHAAWEWEYKKALVEDLMPNPYEH